MPPAALSHGVVKQASEVQEEMSRHYPHVHPLYISFLFRLSKSRQAIFPTNHFQYTSLLWSDWRPVCKHYSTVWQQDAACLYVHIHLFWWIAPTPTRSFRDVKPDMNWFQNWIQATFLYKPPSFLPPPPPGDPFFKNIPDISPRVAFCI